MLLNDLSKDTNNTLSQNLLLTYKNERILNLLNTINSFQTEIGRR